MQGRISDPVEHLRGSFFAKITKKALLKMFEWFLNTPLVKVLQYKRFTECQYLSDVFELIKNMLV